MLVIKNISKNLGSFSLEKISFEIPLGGYFVLLGPSGVGKTVCLEILSGLIPPDSGKIFLDGKEITFQPPGHRGMGYVCQSGVLFPHLSVFENIAYGLRSKRIPREDVREKVLEISTLTGTEKLLHRIPARLSGGEAQRVTLARSLAMEPRCLLLDEPLSALDMAAREDLRRLLRRLNRRGITMIHVTHDYQEAISLATRIGIMEDGKLIQVGSPPEILRHPKSEFVAAFTGVRNFFKGTLEPREGESNLALFRSGDLELSVLTDAPSGPGCLILGSQDVTLSQFRSHGSARNHMEGPIIEIVSAHIGVEVIVDVGVPLTALITAESVESLGLRQGKTIWVGFKASAVRFIPS